VRKQTEIEAAVAALAYHAAALPASARRAILKAGGVEPHEVALVYFNRLSRSVATPPVRKHTRAVEFASRSRSTGKLQRIVANLAVPALDRRSVQNAWQATHIVPELLRATPVAQRPAILADFFRQLHVWLIEARPAKPLTFDQFWPTLETLEEIAAVVVSVDRAHDHGAADVFARSYAKLVSGSADPVVTCALAWGVNEFLERGDASEALGRRIAAELQAADATEQSACILAALTHLRGEIAAVAPQVSSLTNDARLLTASFDRLAAGGTEELRVLLGAHALPGKTKIDLLPSVQRDCALLASREPLTGLLAMATMKRIVRELWRPSARNIAARDAFVREFCELLLGAAAEGKISSFLAIEAIEAVRDKAAPICVAQMLRYLPNASAALAQGIFVCIVEGYEERFAGEQQPVVPRFLLAPPRYRKGAIALPLDKFGVAAARTASDVVHLCKNLQWANGRFALWAA
jgi:hypothetical protein